MALLTRTLSQLAPGQRYMIRISSVASDGSESDLSPAYTFTTIRDVNAPLPPEAPVVDFSTPTMITYWSSSAAALSTDLKDFQVTVYSTLASASGTYYSFSPFTFTIEDNISLFGSATPSINLQIRSRDTSGNLSDPLSAAGSNALPSNITSSTASFTSPDLYLQWNKLSAASDNDISHYRLTLLNSSIPKTVIYSIPSITNSVASVAFQLTYQQNVNDFGRPSGSFSASIVGVDSFNQTSAAPRTFTIINPVPTDYPVLTLAPLIKGFSASWAAASFSDYSYTEVYASVTTPFYASVTAPVWRGTGTYAEYSAATNYSPLYVTARHFDLFGQPGPDSAQGISVTPINPVSADSIPPATPSTGFYSSASLDSTDISGQRFNITASWSPVSDSDLAGYYLKYSLTNTSSVLGTIQATPASANYTVKTNFPGYSGNTYYWWVSSYDKSNNTSSWSALQTIVVPADTTAPASVTNFSVVGNDNVITASWTPVAISTDFNPAVGIGGYRVRSGTDSGLTASVQTFNSLNNRIGFSVPYWSTTYYVTVQPYDTQGNLGASPTPLSVVIGANPALGASAAALAAQTSANGKNIIFYNASTTIPTATASGDTWFVVDTSSALITAFRTASAAGTAAWVERPLTNTTIATLDAGKITTGYLNAGRIQANSLSASVISADTAFINQTLRLGGTASNQLNLVTGASTVAGKIYSGAVGLYNNTTTGFYLDGDGYFSLRDRLTFNPTTSTLTVAGSVVAQSGQFTGSMTAGNLGIGNFGAGVNGIKINSSNYWYDTGNFSLGNGSVTWDGSTLLVDGRIIARSGSFSGNVQVGPFGSLFAGASANAGARTIFNASGVQGYDVSGNSTFLLSGSDGSLRLGNKFIWDGTTLNISGSLTATAGALLNVTVGKGSSKWYIGSDNTSTGSVGTIRTYSLDNLFPDRVSGSYAPQVEIDAGGYIHIKPPSSTPPVTGSVSITVQTSSFQTTIDNTSGSVLYAGMKVEGGTMFASNTYITSVKPTASAVVYVSPTASPAGTVTASFYNANPKGIILDSSVTSASSSIFWWGTGLETDEDFATANKIPFYLGQDGTLTVNNANITNATSPQFNIGELNVQTLNVTDSINIFTSDNSKTGRVTFTGASVVLSGTSSYLSYTVDQSTINGGTSGTLLPDTNIVIGTKVSISGFSQSDYNVIDSVVDAFGYSASGFTFSILSSSFGTAPTASIEGINTASNAIALIEGSYLTSDSQGHGLWSAPPVDSRISTNGESRADLRYGDLLINQVDLEPIPQFLKIYNGSGGGTFIVTSSATTATAASATTFGTTRINIPTDGVVKMELGGFLTFPIIANPYYAEYWFAITGGYYSNSSAIYISPYYGGTILDPLVSVTAPTASFKLSNDNSASILNPLIGMNISMGNRVPVGTTILSITTTASPTMTLSNSLVYNLPTDVGILAFPPETASYPYFTGGFITDYSFTQYSPNATSTSNQSMYLKSMSYIKNIPSEGMFIDVKLYGLLSSPAGLSTASLKYPNFEVTYYPNSTLTRGAMA